MAAFQSASSKAILPPLRMKTVLKLLAVLALACGLGLIVVLMPDGLVASLGEAFSPRGEISAAFIPVFRRILVAVVFSVSLVLLLLASFIRQVCWQCRAISREVRGEMKSGFVFIRQGIQNTSGLERAGLVILALITAGIRLWYLHQPLRYDEAQTFNLYASWPWHISLATYTSPNNHLLNTLLVKISMFIAGHREWALRLPALFSGLLLVGAVYAYARLMYSRTAALAAMAVLSVALPFVDMSTNARGYAIVALCAVVTQICTLLVLRRGFWLAGACNALAIGLGLIAVPVAVLFVGTSILWGGAYAFALYRQGMFAPRNLGRYVLSLCAGGGIALLGYAPMLLVLGPGWLYANEWVLPLPWSTFIARLPGELYAFAGYVPKYVPIPFVVLLVLGGAYYLVQWRKVERPGIPLPLIAGFTCLVALMLNRQYPSWGLSPMWMFLSVFVFAACAGGLAHLSVRWLGQQYARWLVASISVLLAATGAARLVQANPRQTMNPLFTYTVPDSEPIAQYLSANLTGQDKIVADHGTWIYQYYAVFHPIEPTAWDWDLAYAQRVYYIRAHEPDRRYVKWSWSLLRKHGITSTNDFKLAGKFESANIWVAHLDPPQP